MVTAWIADGLAEALDSVAESISHETLILRPESLGIMDPADTSGFYLLSFGLARAAILLLITIGGMWVMTHETLQSRYTVKELAPRIVFAYVGMELSIRILSWVIVHTNAVIDAILTVGFAGVSVDQISQTLQQVADDVREDQSWMALMLILGLLVMLTLLLLGMVSRTLILMLLAIFGPFALACHALPFTEPVAKTWWKALGACVASGIGQALVLVLWFRLFFNGENRTVNPLHMSDAIAKYADMLLIMALLWLMHKAISIPMRKAFAPLGGSPLSPILRVAGSVAMAKTFGLIGRTGAGRTGVGRTARNAAPLAPRPERPPREEPAGGDLQGPPPVHAIGSDDGSDHRASDGAPVVATTSWGRQPSYVAPARRAHPGDWLPARRPFLPRYRPPQPTAVSPPGMAAELASDSQQTTPPRTRRLNTPRRGRTRTYSPREMYRRPGQW